MALLDVDLEVLTPERVSGLVKYCITEEEIEMFSMFDGDVEKLVCIPCWVGVPLLFALQSEAEQFFMALKDVPNISKRLKCLNFRLTFEEELSDHLTALRAVRVGILDIRESVRLQQVHV